MSNGIVNCSFNAVAIKDKQSTWTITDPRTGPCNPEKNSGHGAIVCLIRGTVRSWLQKKGQVGNRVVFPWCRYFFFFWKVNLKNCKKSIIYIIYIFDLSVFENLIFKDWILNLIRIFPKPQSFRLTFSFIFFLKRVYTNDSFFFKESIHQRIKEIMTN